MKYRDNLKIEFRAVPCSSGIHVLEYRISPDQDLNYIETKSFLFSLIKFNVKRKFKTNWHQARHFVNYPSAYRYDKSECYLCIFIHDKNELEKYKYSYSTIGQFFNHINEEDDKNIKDWEKKRKEYLANQNIWT